MAQIKEALAEFNPWWDDKFSLKYKPREIYNTLNKFIDSPHIIALSGLRRVGKTTLMLKFVEDFLNKMGKEKILFFSFDEFKNVSIREVIKEYEILMNQDTTKDKFLFCFDEIQKLNDWENQLKTIYDLNKDRIKIIISGSESLFIRKQARESLAGRIFDFKINTLTFKEFLKFKEFDLKNVELQARDLARLFEEYRKTGGFSELVNIQDKEFIIKYLKEGIIDRIIFKDIPSSFKIENTEKLKALMNIILEEPGQVLESSKLAKELGISRQTVSNYLGYLQDSFLIKKLYNYSKNRRKTERKLKKYYPCIFSQDLLFKQNNLIDSKLFECLIVNQLNAEFFWRDNYKNEVDIILFQQDKAVPIEIKYGAINIKGIAKFLESENIKQGTIISKNVEDKRVEKNLTINIIPAWKFLAN